MATLRRRYIALLIASALSIGITIGLSGMAARKVHGGETPQAASREMPKAAPHALMPALPVFGSWSRM